MFFWPEILVILQGAARFPLRYYINSRQIRLNLESAPASGWASGNLHTNSFDFLELICLGFISTIQIPAQLKIHPKTHAIAKESCQP